MVLYNEYNGNKLNIIHIINKYRRYVSNNLLPNLYCAKNDGTHAPLLSRVDYDDNVYLSCLTCDWEKQAGLVTADHLASLMRWRDLNPSEPMFDTEPIS